MENKYNKSQKKLVNYYSEVVRSDFFVNEFIELRKQAGIEISKPETFKNYSALSGKWGGPGAYALECYHRICEKFDLRFWVWFPLFEEYLKTNKIRNYENVLNSDLIFVEDVIYQKEIPPEYQDDFIEQFDLSYPVAIRISPFVSRRDLEDFVDKFFANTIKPLQEKYKNNELRIGKARSKKNRSRDDFIYKNKKLPRRDISELVWKKYDPMDVGEIGKVISNEGKKRNKM